MSSGIRRSAEYGGNVFPIFCHRHGQHFGKYYIADFCFRFVSRFHASSNGPRPVLRIANKSISVPAPHTRSNYGGQACIRVHSRFECIRARLEKPVERGGMLGDMWAACFTGDNGKSGSNPPSPSSSKGSRSSNMGDHGDTVDGKPRPAIIRFRCHKKSAKGAILVTLFSIRDAATTYLHIQPEKSGLTAKGGCSRYVAGIIGSPCEIKRNQRKGKSGKKHVKSSKSPYNSMFSGW